MATPNPYSAVMLLDNGGVSVIPNKISTSVVQRGNQIFNLGGYNQAGSANTATIEMATYIDGLNGTGGLSGWTTIGNLPTPVSLHEAVMVEDWVYVIGGATGAGAGVASAQVLTLRIESNGTISEMYTETNFPVTITSHSAVAYNNKLYVLGGVQGGSISNVCWVCDLGGNRRPVGNWTQTTPLPAPLSLFGLNLTYDGCLLVTGGQTTGGASVNTYYSAPLQASNGSIGAWTAQTPLNIARANHVSVLLEDTLYVLNGATTAGAPLDSIEYNTVYGFNGKVQSPWVNSGTQATLFVQSTTALDGINYTATHSGTAGNSITVAYNAPAGGTTTIAVVGNAITVSPKAGETNNGLLTVLAGNAPASALVTASLAAGGADVLVTRGAASLAGGVSSGLSTLTPSSKHQAVAFANNTKVYLIGGLDQNSNHVATPQVLRVK